MAVLFRTLFLKPVKLKRDRRPLRTLKIAYDPEQIFLLKDEDILSALERSLLGFVILERRRKSKRFLHIKMWFYARSQLP